jgi:hypothetical protein
VGPKRRSRSWMPPLPMKRTARSRPRVPESLRLAAGTWLRPAAAPSPRRVSPAAPQALPAVRRVRRRCLCVRPTATLPGLKPVLDSSARSPPHQRCEGTGDRPVHSDLVDLRSTSISAPKRNETHRVGARCDIARLASSQCVIGLDSGDAHRAAWAVIRSAGSASGPSPNWASGAHAWHEIRPACTSRTRSRAGPGNQ